MADNRIGIAHLHNFYWKLDFDIDSTHSDDAVEEVNFVLNNGRRTRQTTVFNTETARQVNPTTMRHWRVRDTNTRNANGRSISYDILMNESAHQDIGPAIEPFTFNDFYVTRQNNQEIFASHNPSGGANLAEFVNGESITNNDIVIWSGITFYHMPRSEDAPYMDVHWSKMQIVPRDLTARNVLSDGSNGGIENNTAPQITNIANQSNLTNTVLVLNVQATDINGDSLTYSAAGLPPGLAIASETGQIIGTPTASGNFNVQVNVSDGQVSSAEQFTWTITAVNNNNNNDSNDGDADSGGGGGSFSFAILLGFIFMLSLRIRSGIRIKCTR